MSKIIALFMQVSLHISQEEDILDMIAECEADDKDGKLTSGGSKIPRGPKVKSDDNAEDRQYTQYNYIALLR